MDNLSARRLRCSFSLSFSEDCWSLLLCEVSPSHLFFFFGRWFAGNEICNQSLAILSFIVNAVFKWIMLVPLWSFLKNLNNNKVSLTQPDIFFLTFSLILWQTLPTFVFSLGPPASAGYVICKLKMLISFSLLLNSKAHSNFFFSLLSFAFYFPNIFCLN